MRYSVYQYVKTVNVSVLEALEYVRRSTEKSAYISMIADALDGIEALKEVIEKNRDSLQSEDIFSIFDQIYEVATVLTDKVNEKKSFVEELEQLYIQTVNLKSFFDTKIKYRYQIVFVAELGAKWDAMESVYQAFLKREDCEVSVVLEPVYRAVRYPDGTERSDVLYRDFLTAKGIPFIPFEKYDFEKDKPDMVFISQPYESVTVDKFWPENIAKHSRLVYLPYFTAQSVRGDARKQSLFQMPVLLYSWRIITQSEEMLKWYGRISGKMVTDKVRVTGLPKWDYSVGLKDVQVPQAWKEKLNGKSVFLWNTHYNLGNTSTDILNFAEKVIDYMETQPSLALIWRPHPLTETIVKVYFNGQYYGKWLELLERVNKSSNIIYDNTESYDTAFSCSDALISDLSSLVTQYLLTQKPILLHINQEIQTAKTDLADPENNVVDLSVLPIANDLQGYKEFMHEISQGKDTMRNSRMELLKRDFSNADGKIGERICEMLMEELIDEEAGK